MCARSPASSRGSAPAQRRGPGVRRLQRRQRLRQLFDGYVACDVVPALIERNRNAFSGLNVEFRCIDICGTTCRRRHRIHPSGPAASGNDDVLRVLAKLRKYEFLVLTEHLPKSADFPRTSTRSRARVRACKRGAVWWSPRRRSRSSTKRSRRCWTCMDTGRDQDDRLPARLSRIAIGGPATAAS